MQNYHLVLMLNFNVNLDFGTKHRDVGNASTMKIPKVVF